MALSVQDTDGLPLRVEKAGASPRHPDCIAQWGMNRPPLVTLYDLPLGDLRERAERARRLLRDARASAARLARRDRAPDLRAIGEAIDAAERLLPGLMEQPQTLLARTLRRLAAHERKVLRQAMDAERAARERLIRLLGGVSLGQAEDALERIEVEDAIAAEIAALWRLLDGARAPLLA
jgi:hypothetical protein